MRPQLRQQARRFADRISRTLNRTITDGIRVSAVLEENGQRGRVGYQVSKGDLQGRLIPVSVGKAPSCYLGVLLALVLDPDDPRYLIVERSSYGIYTSDDVDSVVFHYDYTREPDNEYPAAHFQVAGDTDPIRALMARAGHSTPLSRLHFPVGGKRFRPTLEDVVEFLIVERIAEAKDGWQDVLDGERASWYENQLGAAVRRDPATAHRVLADIEASS